MKYIYILIFGLLAGSGAGIAIKGCNRSAVKQVEQITTHQGDSTKYYRDLWGAEHASKLLLEGDRQVIEALYDKRMDSVCKRLGLRERQLQEMAAVIIAGAGSFTAPVVRDTVRINDTERVGVSFKWNDEFAAISGFVDTMSVHIAYQVEVPINISTYWKRRWFLGRKRRYIDAYSDNPNVHITGLTGVKIN